MIFNFVGAAQGGGSDENFQIAMHAKSGVINTTVSSIRAQGLWSNPGLTGVELPSCETIGTAAFMSCKNLQYAIAPLVSVLGSDTFYDCISLSSISFPACTKISSAALGACNLETLEGISNLTEVGYYAFWSAKLLTVDLQHCTSVGSQGFIYCASLKTVNLPVCSLISSSAFVQCVRLETISIPECTTFGSNVFNSCSSLRTISLPKCKNLTDHLFYNCRKLSSIYLLSTSMTTMGNQGALWNTPMSYSSYLGYFGSIYVPSSLVDTYKAATNWSVYSDRITAYIE